MQKNWSTIVTVVLAIIACAVAWGAAGATVAQHTKEITALKVNDAAIVETLSRIDKNQALITQRLEVLEKKVGP